MMVNIEEGSVLLGYYVLAISRNDGMIEILVRKNSATVHTKCS